ncbi:MAG: FG-GAP repeat protein [Kofleriaceae bacterium]
MFDLAGESWVQQAYLKASNTGAGDEVGFALALAADGRTLVTGADNEDSAATGRDGAQTDATAGMDSGAAYVFTEQGVAWRQAHYVKAPNTAAATRSAGPWRCPAMRARS